jgi:tripartite ATP-independent transporter DctM subunit
MPIIAFLMFFAIVAILLVGYPVAFTLAGTALLFALGGVVTGVFDPAFLETMPNRIFGIMSNQTLIAVPLFVFMGVTLERARIAEGLLDTLSMLFGRLRGGLGIAVIIVGMLMAASTGIVGATVITMGLLALPTMLKRGYDPAVATGTISASGTLGQIIPPSIILVLLGDVISSAYQQSQIDREIFSPQTVSVGDLFVGAVFPGLLLVGLYILWLIILGIIRPQSMPTHTEADISGPVDDRSLLVRVVLVLIPPMLLILTVLGSIIGGLATPTEAAAVGATGALLLALLRRQLNKKRLKEIMRNTTRFTSMVFLILIGASMFSLVFRGYSGDDAVREFLTTIPGGTVSAMLIVMAVMFLLGFVLDFIEITFVVVPIVGPVLLSMGIDPVWLGIMIAINLQTSFLTPPFGFALFYLRGVAPPEVSTAAIYRGIIPFVLIQLFTLMLLAYWPALATWLPALVYGN